MTSFSHFYLYRDINYSYDASNVYIKTNMATIGSEVRARRKNKKLSQTELAQAAGVSLNVVRSIESEKDTVTLKNLKKVLFLFGLELTLKSKGT